MDPVTLEKVAAKVQKLETRLQGLEEQVELLMDSTDALVALAEAKREGTTPWEAIKRRHGLG